MARVLKIEDLHVNVEDKKLVKIDEEIAKNIENNPLAGESTVPTKNISLISPPPRLSFLNILLPRSISKYIIENKCNIDSNPLPIPYPKKLISSNKIEDIIVTSSGIIKYLTSLTITITKKEDIIRDIQNLIEKEKTI